MVAVGGVGTCGWLWVAVGWGGGRGWWWVTVGGGWVRTYHPGCHHIPVLGDPLDNLVGARLLARVVRRLAYDAREIDPAPDQVGPKLGQQLWEQAPARGEDDLGIAAVDDRFEPSQARRLQPAARSEVRHAVQHAVDCGHNFPTEGKPPQKREGG